MSLIAVNMPKNGEKHWMTQGILLPVLLSSVVTFSLVLGVMLWLQRSSSYIFLSRSNCWEKGEVSFCLLTRQLADADALSVMTSFYSNVIIVVIAMLTAAAAFTAVTIKASAKSHVENELPHLTENYFEGTKGKVYLESLLNDRLKGTMADIEAIKAKMEDDRGTLFGVIEKVQEMQGLIDVTDLNINIDLDGLEDEE